MAHGTGLRQEGRHLRAAPALQSKRLLADRSTPITAIALAVGYQTPSSFASIFRRITGSTPSAFRAAA